MKEELVKNEGRNERSLWAPFIVGGLVGAGIALLVAPKSGKELRKDIKDIAATSRDTIASTVEKGKELYVEGTSAVKNAIEAGKNAIEAGKMAYVEERERHRQAA